MVISLISAETKYGRLNHLVINSLVEEENNHITVLITLPLTVTGS